MSENPFKIYGPIELPAVKVTPDENARIQAWFRDWQRGLVDLPLWVRDPGRAPPSAREMK